MLASWPLIARRDRYAACAALFGVARRALDDWTLSELDERLLAMFRTRARGRAEAVVECEACGAKLELDVPLVANARAAHRPSERALEIDGYEVIFRAARVGDVAAVEACRAVEDARHRLVLSCIRRVRKNGRDVSPPPQTVIAAVADLLDAEETGWPAALAWCCAQCAEEGMAVVDPASFVLSAFAPAARELMADIAALASAFGWTEREILEVPNVRRRLYLASVRDGLL